MVTATASPGGAAYVCEAQWRTRGDADPSELVQPRTK